MWQAYQFPCFVFHYGRVRFDVPRFGADQSPCSTWWPPRAGKNQYSDRAIHNLDANAQIDTLRTIVYFRCLIAKPQFCDDHTYHVQASELLNRALCV